MEVAQPTGKILNIDFGWLVDSIIGWLLRCQVGWPIDCFNDKLVGLLVAWLIDLLRG